jgi:hypothetical protein
MAMMSLRAYAKHRGCALNAVQAAIKAGRISWGGKGTLIDSELADNQWSANTNFNQQPAKLLEEAARQAKIAAAAGGDDGDDGDEGDVITPTVHKGRSIGESDASGLIKAKADREYFEAKRAEMRFRAEAGELVPLNEVNQYVSGMIMRAKDIFMRMPRELRDRLAQEVDPIKCQRMLEKEVTRGLSTLAEYQPKYGNA